MTIVFYKYVKNAYSHVSTPLIPCVTPLAVKRARTWRSMLSTRVLTHLKRHATHTWRAASRNFGTVEWGLGSSMSQIQIPIWSQTCSIGLMSGLRIDQSMASTSCCARKEVVSHALWGMALLSAYRKFHSKAPVAQVSILSWCGVGGWGIYPAPPVHSSHHKNIGRHTVHNIVSWLYPKQWQPWWMTRHAMNMGPRLPSLGRKHAFISLSPCLWHPRARPPLCNRVKWNSSLKTQRLQWLKSHDLCIFLNIRRRCIWSKVKLGYLLGRINWLPAVKSLVTVPELTTSSETGGSSPRSDEERRLNDGPLQLRSTVCPSGSGLTPPISMPPLNG